MVAAVVVLSACGNDNPADPLAEFEPEVNNATDSFQLQASDVSDVGATMQYTWQNTGSLAAVDHSTTTSAGGAGLVIRDADGTVVYDQALAPSLNEDTSSGTAGMWTITLGLSDYSGTLNFRVQKK
jgi:hypothetical protein